MFTKSRLFVVIATTSAVLCIPGAYAGSEFPDFPPQASPIEGGGKVSANVPAGPTSPAAPKQAANRQPESQPTLSDASAPGFAPSSQEVPPQAPYMKEWSDDWGH
jgi:hypothetical protein